MRRKYNVQYSFIYRFGQLIKYATRHMRAGCVLVFMLAAMAVQAQDDSTDMTEEITDEEVESTPDDYFIPKWMEGSEMDPMVLRHLPDSALEALKKDKAFWYADSVFRRQQRQRQQQAITEQQKRDSIRYTAPPREYESREPIAERSWFQTLLWIVIIGGFAAFMGIYLMNSNVRLFNRKRTQIGGQEEEEPEMDDIFAINYQKEIDKAAGNGNYRLAIRLMFLRLLKNLSEGNIIQYKHDRTNLDYLMQLSTTRYYKDFFRITRNYEYSWYGKFPVSDEAYKVIKNDFDHFDPTIK